MKNKVYELKHTRAGWLNKAKAAYDGRDQEGYEAAMAEVEKLNAEITRAEALLAEEGRFDDNDTEMVTLAQTQERKKADEKLQSKLDTARSGNEYARAFAAALRMGASIESGRSHERLKPLYAALTETGGTPEGADGGFLVPIDFDDMIHEVQRGLSPLEQEFALENVNTLTGWRAMDTAPATGFSPVEEMEEVEQDDQPSFKRIDYSVRMYGLIVPVSRELMQDNTAGLMRYLANWFGKKAVITKNQKLLALLATLVKANVAEGEEIKALKRALNVTLDPMIASNAVILTNQSGFSVIDELEDLNGNSILQPDFTEPSKFRVLGHRMIVVSNRFLPNISATAAPVYIGDMKQYGTLFQRMPYEFASTDIGGNAWRTVSTETRGLMRLDAKTMDAEAATALALPIAE